jgi:hypothetical protein
MRVTPDHVRQTLFGGRLKATTEDGTILSLDGFSTRPAIRVSYHAAWAKVSARVGGGYCPSYRYYGGAVSRQTVEAQLLRYLQRMASPDRVDAEGYPTSAYRKEAITLLEGLQKPYETPVAPVASEEGLSEEVEVPLQKEAAEIGGHWLRSRSLGEGIQMIIAQKNKAQRLAQEAQEALAVAKRQERKANAEATTQKQVAQLQLRLDVETGRRVLPQWHLRSHPGCHATRIIFTWDDPCNPPPPRALVQFNPVWLGFRPWAFDVLGRTGTTDTAYEAMQKADILVNAIHAAGYTAAVDLEAAQRLVQQIHIAVWGET